MISLLVPALGFGTAGLFGDELAEAVKHAVKVGYRSDFHAHT